MPRAVVKEARQNREEIGICVGCNQWLRAGEVVVAYDDEVGHADCSNPTSLDFTLDAESPPGMVLIGNPSRYIPAETLKALLSRKDHPHAD